MTEKHSYLLNKWKLLIEDRLSSGMKVEEWCEANGHTRNEYYYWLRELRKENLSDAINKLPSVINKTNEPSIVELPIIPGSAVHCSTESPNRPAAIIKANSISIELYSGADSVLVKQLIEAVVHA